MGDIENQGILKQYDDVTVGPDDCLTIIYTSGSSGFPKGAMMSESAFRANFPHWCVPMADEYVLFSYRSLAWSSDRKAVSTLFLSGGRTGFFTGDNDRLMEEVAIIRPTSFAGTPAVWNKIYTEFNTALALSTGHLSPAALQAEEQRLLRHFSKLMPNRCRGISIGGAMVSPAVIEFMKRCFTHCIVDEVYGITECGSVAYANNIEKTVQYRLESVPHLDYTVNDQPYPRGELLVKTKQMFSGYINSPQETADALTDDGFFRTGDIVELRASSTTVENQLQIHVIDRKKNFFKLAQGQFISPEYLQSLFIQSLFIDQVFIHADLMSDTLTAVVVPNRGYVQLFINEQNHLTALDESDPPALLFDAILTDLRSIGERESLRPHEIPSRLIIDFQPFTPENGFLTSSMKLCRYKIAAHYAHRFKSTSANVQQRLQQIIESVRGKRTDEQETSLISSGTDSLSTVRLSKMIENDLGISIPLHILFDPNVTVEQLTDLIQNPSQLQTLSSSTTSQLISEYQSDSPVGEVKPSKASADYPSVIFITGITGFVGAFLLAELLRVYPSHCRMICLVRCASSIDPLQCLRETMISYQIWNGNDEHRLIALRGDLSKSSFGLDEQVFQSLVDQIDLIFHCAANVNFILSAHQLARDSKGQRLWWVCRRRSIVLATSVLILERVSPIPRISTLFCSRRCWECTVILKHSKVVGRCCLLI